MKKNPKFYLALVIFCLTGQIAWVVENMYFNVFIYKMFNASAEAISTMVAASAIAATVTTVLIGALSDKLGKRKIFICSGYILWGISIWSFSLLRMDVLSALFPAAASAAAVGVSATIILDCVMTFFGSSANDACFNAWLTDVTDETNRGRVEGINAMMPLVAILVVFGGFMSFDLNKWESWNLIFYIIGIAVILIGIAGFFLIAATNKHSRLSETENRMLAAFPDVNARTLSSGEFMSGFEDFLSDAFFGRDQVVQLTNGLLDGSIVGAYEETGFRKGDVARLGMAELWYQCDA